MNTLCSAADPQIRLVVLKRTTKDFFPKCFSVFVPLRRSGRAPPCKTRLIFATLFVALAIRETTDIYSCRRGCRGKEVSSSRLHLPFPWRDEEPTSSAWTPSLPPSLLLFCSVFFFYSPKFCVVRAHFIPRRLFQKIHLQVFLHHNSQTVEPPCFTGNCQMEAF